MQEIRVTNQKDALKCLSLTIVLLYVSINLIYIHKLLTLAFVLPRDKYIVNSDINTCVYVYNFP